MDRALVRFDYIGRKEGNGKPTIVRKTRTIAIPKGKLAIMGTIQ